jgi:hypothetical protein
MCGTWEGHRGQIHEREWTHMSYRGALEGAGVRVGEGEGGGTSVRHRGQEVHMPLPKVSTRQKVWNVCLHAAYGLGFRV